MRLTNFLFVAATALLASCEATSAAKDSTQTKLSTMTSPNAIQSIDAVNGGKRFLRTTKTENRHGQTWVKKWVGKVNGWAIAGKTPIQIKEKIQGFRSSLSLEAKDKYNLFLAAWLQLHPGGF
ncbi:hypothetical protein BBO99_00008800 [Phytophthora kernoviae]|uniref:RxLR effector protein n=1 Tax=Phytophthora kernoviae TaxID=325452 RepID=A0A421GE30_9STRA|nr:hypothetical protein JM16_009519 [Phytophthora kernoviae]KAG2503022.1 hypothetical protein JM18_009680 [Phytophthora kernoviae]RLN06034.1 hypothetical protein BBI17_009279 [Phytophthora kernoviae]RLN74677.1 hypothetical protein BBO99_00008800 [Phytophthora kernoviae]